MSQKNNNNQIEWSEIFNSVYGYVLLSDVLKNFPQEIYCSHSDSHQLGQMIKGAQRLANWIFKVFRNLRCLSISTVRVESTEF